MISRNYGSPDTPRIECTNPRHNLWRVRWDFQQDAETGLYSFLEYEFGHKPDIGEIRDLIFKSINDEVDKAILQGFQWEGEMVWLSVENQLNYKAAYDLAIQTEGASLPITLKFGTDVAPVFRTFATVHDLSEFYLASVRYVQQQVSLGWERKSLIDFSPYYC